VTCKTQKEGRAAKSAVPRVRLGGGPGGKAEEILWEGKGLEERLERDRSRWCWTRDFRAVWSKMKKLKPKKSRSSGSSLGRLVRIGSSESAGPEKKRGRS